MRKSRLCFILPFALICYAYVSVNYTILYNIGIFGNGIQSVYNTIEESDHKNSDIKYILLWPSKDSNPFHQFKNGKLGFLDRNCSNINCYLTDDRNLLGDIRKFQAIAFNGRGIKNMWSGLSQSLPERRSPNQIYIYINSASADDYVICVDDYKNFFNWTCTYRLDSDIPMPNIAVKNRNGIIAAPKRGVDWKMDDTGFEQDIHYGPKVKTKAVIWFVSKCDTNTNREYYAVQLLLALYTYNLTIDVYGSCGNLKCRQLYNECKKLMNNYYFTLAFEDTIAEDYVTDIPAVAMNYNSVPIVFGGANYSWFLPPGSYVDAKQVAPPALAALIHRAIQSPGLYRQYFRWRQTYSIHVTNASPICDICSALHNTTMLQSPKTYEDIRAWWHPNYRAVCSWHYKLLKTIVCVLIVFCMALVVVLKLQ